MTQRILYFDNSTTASPSKKAVSQMMPFLTEMWGTPSAPHQKGQELYSAIRDSYKQLYSFLGAKEEDTFVLTSSGSEAVNHVIHSVYRETTLPTGKNQFLTSKVDEAPAIMAVGALERLGCVGKMVPVNNQGLVTAESLATALSPRTALLSLSWGNGLTGPIQPLGELSALCRQRGILLHLEATHILGKLMFSLEETGADFITFNGDQLHGPRGTGGLWVRHGVKCAPFISGGSDQGGLRAGALNVPGLVGLAAACKEGADSVDYICTEIARLRDKLENGIIEKIPETSLFFRNQERLPHVTSMAFPGVSNEALLFLLNRKGICASIGGGHFQQLALMLIESGINEKTAQEALSFSLSRYTTEQDIDEAIPLIVESVIQLQKLSQKLVS